LSNIKLPETKFLNNTRVRAAHITGVLISP